MRTDKGLSSLEASVTLHKQTPWVTGQKASGMARFKGNIKHTHMQDGRPTGTQENNG